MASDFVPNVLADRYASPAMKALWSTRGRVILEREYWIAVMKAQRDLGLDIPAEAIAAARTAAKKDGAALLLVEGIALVRSGLAAAFDALLRLDAPREIRAARFAARGGTRSDFDRRDAAQAGLATELRDAGAIEIDASGSPEQSVAAAAEAIRRVCFSGDDHLRTRR